MLISFKRSFTYKNQNVNHHMAAKLSSQWAKQNECVITCVLTTVASVHASWHNGIAGNTFDCWVMNRISLLSFPQLITCTLRFKTEPTWTSLNSIAGGSMCTSVFCSILLFTSVFEANTINTTFTWKRPSLFRSVVTATPFRRISKLATSM